MNKVKSNILGLVVLALIFSGCSNKTDSLFRLVSSQESGIQFNNEMNETKAVNYLKFTAIYNGGGVAVGDIDNDGLEDLFFTGNLVDSKLYLNKGGLKFEDITTSSGVSTEGRWCNGVSIVDINTDGFNDIYVSVSGPDNSNRENLLFINNGNQTFTESARAFGLDDSGHSTHSAFFDYDLDGDLDIYMLTYGNNEGTDLSLVNKKVTDGSAPSNDKLYRNNGDNTFTNVAQEAGILIEGYGLGIAINDLNNDNYPDIYVSNDFLFDDILYINNQDGTFTDRSKEYLNHTSVFGMGVDFQDFNNDMMPDIVQVDMMPKDNYRQKKILGPMQFNFFNLSLKEGYTPQYMRNSLQINQGEKGFSEIGQLAGVHETDWSWAPMFADFDANGSKDLYITNGFRRNVSDWDFRNYIGEQIRIAKDEGKDPDEIALAIIKKTDDVKLSNYAYTYKGDLTFSDVTKDWGLSKPTWSNGMIYADLDNDGDLDMVVSNIDDVAHVYENTLDEKEETPNYLKVSLRGIKNNPEGIGAKIVVNQADVKQSHYQTKTRGYLSNVTSEIHFGFGDNSSPAEVKITWPNGKVQTLSTNLNTSLVLDIQDAADPDKIEDVLNLTSGNRASELGLDHLSPENDYVDFNYEPLLPHRLSQAGPAIAKEDINGDGLDDLYVGGSTGSPGYTFIQNSRGTFKKMTLADSDVYEDADALFFDADNDGDMDLYVCSGSNEFEALDERYQDRLYVNNGKGEFELASSMLPEMFTSSGTVAANDYDGDGDLDLFVGGRLSPRKYPMPGQSYILRNDGGSFSDVTTNIADGLQDIGMVTSSVWADMNGDNQIDLVLTGEFMPITIFEQNDGRFVNRTSSLGLSNYTGWWNTISICDINGDGKLDILAGNLGENTKYKVSTEQPLSVFAKDYDNNGMLDAIMSCFIENEEHLLHSKSTLEGQVIGFKKRFVKHESFAKATFDDIISPELREGAYLLRANTFKHMAFMNSENGFEGIALPNETQVAPLKVIRNIGDQYFLSGNDYATEVVVGQYDASNGFQLYYDNSEKKFKVNPKTSYRASGDIKSAVSITVGNKVFLVHSVTGESLYVSGID